MGQQSLDALEEILNLVTEKLPKVTAKKMFGCHAVWADGNVFALVWKHGRIGVKLPDAADYEKLMAIKGAEPWKAGPMQMAHWVLVPEFFHDQTAELKKWAGKAHEQCAKLEKKPKKTGASKGKSAKTNKKKVK